MTAGPIPDEIRAEAALWLARHEGGSLDAEARAAFENWLTVDPLHRRAYHQMVSVYALLDAPARKLHARESRSRDLRRAFRPRLGWLVPPALIAALCAGVWLVTPGLIQNLQADIVSSRDLVSEITLPDGSRAYLGANTALALDFSAGRRELTLLRGEAYFDVRHADTGADLAPFTVHVGPDQIRDIGTRFAIERQSTGATVAVTQGEVEVRAQNDANPQRLIEGERLVITEGHAQPVEPSDTDTALAWMDGRLVVEAARLSDVARTLERHTPGRIVLRGDADNRLISGTFPLTDVDGTLETMAAALDLSVTRITPYLIILG
ncbi:FecR family protein [Paracoccus aminophilus]|uniref:FecR-like transmembrane sensor n=1 Tax=Paracoccus aminophilus JCM 7686 TaxID=1367847 RepID=S5Z0Y0_PARAH|nr:FecR domain-containing protein [Paracoccus aminophilus]AGT11081.1 FecR-like transmembrane sensor [Paracoccus aminophilus JCM 7686]